MIIRSATFPVSGNKRPQYAPPNPVPGKRPYIPSSKSVIEPASGYPRNEFTSGGAPARDKPSEMLTTSRFDDEFGDDFNLDRIVALTDIALKNSGLEPMNSLPPNSASKTRNCVRTEAPGSVPQQFAAPSSSSTQVADRRAAPCVSSLPQYPANNRSNQVQQFQDPAAMRSEQCALHMRPITSTNTRIMHDPNSMESGGLTFDSRLQTPQNINQIPGAAIPNAAIAFCATSMEFGGLTFDGRLQRPQNINQIPGPAIPSAAIAPSSVASATPTQQFMYSCNEPISITKACSKERSQQPGVSVEEYNRLRVMFNECSQERGKLRLHQKQLQSQIADKSGALTMLRSKLNSLESQLNKSRTEMTQRAAQKNDAHKAQHARMKATIDSLNLERESLDRELGELGRTNESLTRALSSERQLVQSLKRQLSAISDSSHFIHPNSPEKDTFSRNDQAKSSSACQNPEAALPTCNKSKQLSYQHNASDTLIPKVVSSSLEDGLLELVRDLDISKLHTSLGMELESQLGLLINGSYPVFYAVPILKPILDHDEISLLIPGLRTLYILVTFDARSRQIVLGPPNCSRTSQSQSTECYFENFSPKLVPCPVWAKPGTCIALSKAGLDQLDISKYSFKNFYRPEEESLPSDSTECAGIVNSLMNVLNNRNGDFNEVVKLSLSILLELLRHAQNHQIPKFSGLLDTGLLQSLFAAIKDANCQTIILMIYTHLLWYEDNLRLFVTNSSHPSALQCAYLAMELRPGPQDHVQTTTLHLAAMDVLGFILGKYGQRGVNVLLYGSLKSHQRRPDEQQVLPKLAAVMMAQLDIHDGRSAERLQLISKGMSLIETLLPHVKVTMQTTGYRFRFLSLLTRIIQLGDDLLADQASTIRLQLIETGCLDLLPRPDRGNDSASLSA